MALARDQQLLIAGGGDNCVRLLPLAADHPRGGARGGRASWKRACEAAPGARPRRRRQRRVSQAPATSSTSGGSTAPTCARILDDAKRAQGRARSAGPRAASTPTRRRADRTLAMIFEKNSTRTRFSFDAAIRQLGGALDHLHRRRHAARPRRDHRGHRPVLSRMVDAVMIRANRHEDVRGACGRPPTVPVINGLSDARPPLPDHGRPADLRGASRPGARARRWPGSATATTSAPASSTPRPKLGFKLNIACPAAYHPDLVDLAARPSEQGRVEVDRRPARGGRGRRRGDHRHLGLHGRHRPRRAAGGAGALPGRRGADGAGRRRTPSSCTACPPTAARRSPTR